MKPKVGRCAVHLIQHYDRRLSRARALQKHVCPHGTSVKPSLYRTHNDTHFTAVVKGWCSCCRCWSRRSWRHHCWRLTAAAVDTQPKGLRMSADRMADQWGGVVTGCFSKILLNTYQLISVKTPPTV